MSESRPDELEPLLDALFLCLTPPSLEAWEPLLAVGNRLGLWNSVPLCGRRSAFLVDSNGFVR